MIYCKLFDCLVFASTKSHLWVLLQKKVYMARELELLNYEATMVRCSNSAIKLLIWWGNNIGGGTMLISENELKESADLAIAFWKKQIELCPNITKIEKEFYKELFEKTVRNEVKELKNNLQEVLPRRYCFIRVPPTKCLFIDNEFSKWLHKHYHILCC